MASPTRLQPATATPDALTWHDVACPLCGQRDTERLFEAADVAPGTGQLRFGVVRCRGCSLTYTNPRPDPASIGRFYPQGYAPHRMKRDEPKRPPSALLAWLLGRPCRERRVLPWQGSGRLLDFGCGSGDFLDRMARQGWRVTGLDTSEATIQTIREQLHLDALAGTLPHPALDSASFDVVTLWQSLEHVHDPLDTLREARELLVPGGRVYVAVPNFNSWPARRFREDWYSLDLPRHLTHFTPITLKKMLEAAGFTVERQSFLSHVEWLRGSWRLARARGAAGRWQRLFASKLASRLGALACYWAGQADCMLAVARKSG